MSLPWRGQEPFLPALGSVPLDRRITGTTVARGVHRLEGRETVVDGTDPVAVRVRVDRFQTIALVDGESHQRDDPHLPCIVVQFEPRSRQVNAGARV